MKKTFIILSLLLCSLSAFPFSETTAFQNLADKAKIAVSKSDKLDMLRELRGDTIIFDFGYAPYVDFFFTENPDTIWIKERPKKNAKEGKHYELTKVYKHFKNGDKYVTPASVLNGKPFAVLNVEDWGSSSYYSSDVKLRLKLVDLDNLTIVDCELPTSSGNNFEIRVPKIDRQINSLVGKTYYMNDNTSYTPNFRKVTFADGEYKILFDYHHSTSTYNTSVALDFITEDGFKIPYKNQSSYSLRNKDYLVTEDDYNQNYTQRTINSLIDYDILNKDLVTPFNFGFIIGIPNGSHKYISQTIDPRNVERYGSVNWTSSYRHAPLAAFIIAGSTKVKGTKFLKAIYNGKAFFIKEDDVDLDETNTLRLDSLERCDDEIRDFFFNQSLLLSQSLYANKIDDALGQINSLKQYGLGIYSYGVYDESQYTEGTGFRITFFNPTQQMIKYVSLTFQGYNAVDDPVGRAITKKCIGPIDPDRTAAYNFDYAWFTDIVEYAKIRSITVTYKNGSTKTISNIKNILIPEEVRETLFTTHPLDDFN